MSLIEQAALYSKRQKRMAIALAVVVAAGVAGGYLPKRNALAAMESEIEKVAAEVAANRDRAETLPTLIAEINQLRRQVDRYRPLRDRSDVERAVTEIGAIQTATQLKQYQYTTADYNGPAHSSFSEQPMKITFQSDFIDAMSFVEKIEAMDRLTRMRELSIKANNPSGASTGTGNVTVNMSLSLFFASTDQ